PSVSSPVKIPWIVPGLVAPGVVTLVTGKPKAAGKSTLIGHLVGAVLDGKPFAGMPTSASQVVYLTEEREPSFRSLLERAGVLGRSELTFLSHGAARGATLPELLIAAKEVCKEKGAKLLVIDTVAQFAGLGAEGE